MRMLYMYDLNNPLLGPYSRTIPRVLGDPKRGVSFLRARHAMYFATIHARPISKHS
jgi:hypothetical protein